ncbi:MAG: 7-cyano-7-deazaguanine synthase QueC [Thermoguttaceae bacterium]
MDANFAGININIYLKTNKMKKRVVVLLSGGLDSATVTALARSRGEEIFALTIDYNQRHRVELEAAKRVADTFGVVRHVIIPIDLRLFGGSSLTDESLEVPQNTPDSEIGLSIPNTYVPARNTVFLSLALAFAESVAAQKIYLGISQIDYSGYPDCRPEFLHAFEALAKTATKAGVENEMTFKIEAPLLHLSKKETIELGISLGVDYSMTFTCYSPNEKGEKCGKCESCQLRMRAFEEIGKNDPAP